MKKLLLSLAAAALFCCLFATQAFAETTAVATAGVNMRSGPSTEYSVITVVPSGAVVTVQSQDSSGWWYCNYNGAEGWVYSSYLGNTALNVASGSSAYTVTGAVNMRSGPGTDYSVYGVVPQGSTIYVSSVANGWALATYGGTTGYVSTSYISGLGGSASTGAHTSSIDGGTTWYNGVNYAAVYNPSNYLTYNPDLRTAIGNDPNALIQHFVNYGMSEGRQGSHAFNVYNYQSAHPELRQYFGNDLRSYYLYYMGAIGLPAPQGSSYDDGGIQIS